MRIIAARNQGIRHRRKPPTFGRCAYRYESSANRHRRESQIHFRSRRQSPVGLCLVSGWLIPAHSRSLHRGPRRRFQHRAQNRSYARQRSASTRHHSRPRLPLSPTPSVARASACALLPSTFLVIRDGCRMGRAVVGVCFSASRRTSPRVSICCRAARSLPAQVRAALRLSPTSWLVFHSAKVSQLPARIPILTETTLMTLHISEAEVHQVLTMPMALEAVEEIS